MFSLIIGASASGKSEYAEALVRTLPGERIYLATMEPWDDECRARIEKHRVRRSSDGFRTIERYTDLSGAEVPEGANLLLECMSNLLANEMYAPPRGDAACRDDCAGRILSGVARLKARCRNLTVVTNEIVSGGAEYGAETLRYMKLLGKINRALAEEADLVCEVVCGRCSFLKGGEAVREASS